MFNERVRAVLGARALLDDNDPRIEEKWAELIEILSENEDLTLGFLKECTKTELSLLSEVFEDVAYNLQSKKFIELLYQLDKRYPDLELKDHIQLAEDYMN
jgi:predicted lipid carrier protein YhbT